MTTHKYSKSAQELIGVDNLGLRVETPVLTALATYFTNGNVYTVFNVVGAVKVMALYFEATGLFDANATTLLLKATWTTPALGPGNIGAAVAVNALAVGARVMWQGTSDETTAPVIGVAAHSVLPSPFLFGGDTAAGVNWVGIIACTNGAATQAGVASGRWVCHYFPITEGAYVTSAI